MGPELKLPKMIPAEWIAKQRAVQQALDKLRYGKFNPKAKEVEAQALADFHKPKM